MKNYIPKVYKRNIYEIDYSKLKTKKIKCIIFDLDNTLITMEGEYPSKKTINLFKDLKKEFSLYVMSNNKDKERIRKVADSLDVDYVGLALKPFSRGFKKILKKEGLKPEECANIGDQLVTDVLGGNRLGIYTILIDPIAKKELKVTKINRLIENRKLQKLKERNLFERGKYYGW